MEYDIVSGEFVPLIGALDFVGAQPRGGAYGGQLAQLANRQNQMFQSQMQQQAMQQQAMQQQALQQRALQGSQLLRTMSPTKARRQTLGMVSNGTIAAAGTATITARPQTFAFKPERIVIPATIAPDFTIQDIKVGNISQLVQSGDLPAEMFVQGGVDVGLDMDTVQTSQDFILQVTNISGAPRTFRAGIVGRSANG